MNENYLLTLEHLFFRKVFKGRYISILLSLKRTFAKEMTINAAAISIFLMYYLSINHLKQYPMSVKYSVAHMRNPLKPEEPYRFYAKAQVREKVDLKKIAKELGGRSALEENDILSTLHGLIANIKNHLSNGDMVDLGDFGSFQYQLSCEGAVTFDALALFPKQYIRKARIQFRPGKLLKPNLQNLEFEQVVSVKTREESRKTEREQY